MSGRCKVSGCQSCLWGSAAVACKGRVAVLSVERDRVQELREEAFEASSNWHVSGLEWTQDGRLLAIGVEARPFITT